MDTHREVRELAERYTEAWSSGDPKRVAECYSPNGWLQVNGAAPAVGRTAITEVARSYMTAFPDMVLTTDEVLVRDEDVFYHWTLEGTNSGPGGTGKRVHLTGMEEWKVRDGMIAESRGRYDEALYQKQLREGV